MYTTASALSENVRGKIIEDLGTCLAEGLDLYSQIKTAHWNLRGPNFAALHPLFDKFARKVARYSDEIAERAVALGGHVRGTVRNAAKGSRLPEYPSNIVSDLEHSKALSERFASFAESLKSVEESAQKVGDAETANMLAGMVMKMQKYAWFLNATIDRTFEKQRVKAA